MHFDALKVADTGVKALNQILLEMEALSKETLCNAAWLRGWNPVSKVL